VVAAVPGQRYVDFMRKESLEPLGMSRSRFALEQQFSL
jgi:CubicO group peptidase (beta-lactamase class C family)